MSCDEADYLVPFCPLLPTKCMSFPFLQKENAGEKAPGVNEISLRSWK
jgi:hypothetical protein